jgi:hypothetical protein
MGDPVIIAVVVGAVAVVALTVIARIWRRGRESLEDRRHRAEVRAQRGYLERQRREVERMASRIIATSSTATIAGFRIIRQIEAVFTDGQPSPNKAVELLKALAAEKGANAIINLHSVRPPSGKCLAHGDAVIVQPEEQAPAVPPLPPLPPVDDSDDAGNTP